MEIMRLPSFLVPPDESAPAWSPILLGIVGLLGILQGAVLFAFSYFAWDFGPFCLGFAAPWGIVGLALNGLVYRDVRRRQSNATISSVTSSHLSCEMMIVNGLAVFLGSLCILAGAELSPTNTEWVSGLTPFGLAGGGVFITLVFYPFNAVALIGGATLQFLAPAGSPPV